MTDRPMIFSAPMVKAMQEGRKSQTRRILKPQPDFEARGCTNAGLGGRNDWWDYWGGGSKRFRAPYAVGDRLWVREAWRPVHGNDPSRGAQYRADIGMDQTVWRSPIHMFRWASRLTLTVTDVRVQQLRRIREADAEAEGAPPVLVPPDGGSCPHVEGYRDLWNSLHGTGAWDLNPFVCAVSFTVRKGNIDEATP